MELVTLAQVRAGWPKLVAKEPLGIAKPQLRSPQCDTRVTPEEKRRFLARRAQNTKQRRALFNADYIRLAYIAQLQRNNNK